MPVSRLLLLCCLLLVRSSATRSSESQSQFHVDASKSHFDPCTICGGAIVGNGDAILHAGTIETLQEQITCSQLESMARDGLFLPKTCWLLRSKLLKLSATCGCTTTVSDNFSTFEDSPSRLPRKLKAFPTSFYWTQPTAPQVAPLVIVPLPSLTLPIPSPPPTLPLFTLPAPSWMRPTVPISSPPIVPYSTPSDSSPPQPQPVHEASNAGTLSSSTRTMDFEETAWMILKDLKGGVLQSNQVELFEITCAEFLSTQLDARDVACRVKSQMALASPGSAAGPAQVEVFTTGRFDGTETSSASTVFQDGADLFIAALQQASVERFDKLFRITVVLDPSIITLAPTEAPQDNDNTGALPYNLSSGLLATYFCLFFMLAALCFCGQDLIRSRKCFSRGGLPRWTDSDATVVSTTSTLQSDMTTRRVVVPSGDIGVTLHKTTDGPIVRSIKEQGPSRGVLFPGDLLLAVNDTDTRALSELGLAALLARTSGQQRELIVSSKDVSDPSPPPLIELPTPSPLRIIHSTAPSDSGEGGYINTDELSCQTDGLTAESIDGESVTSFPSDSATESRSQCSSFVCAERVTNGMKDLGNMGVLKPGYAIADESSVDDDSRTTNIPDMTPVETASSDGDEQRSFDSIDEVYHGRVSSNFNACNMVQIDKQQLREIKELEPYIFELGGYSVSDRGLSGSGALTNGIPRRTDGAALGALGITGGIAETEANSIRGGEKNVSFGNLHVREYERCVDTSLYMGLSLGWGFVDLPSFPLPRQPQGSQATKHRLSRQGGDTRHARKKHNGERYAVFLAYGLTRKELKQEAATAAKFWHQKQRELIAQEQQLAAEKKCTTEFSQKQIPNAGKQSFWFSVLPMKKLDITFAS